MLVNNLITKTKKQKFGDIFSTMEQELDQFLKNKWPSLQETFGFEPFSKVAYPKVNIMSNSEHFVMVFETCGCNKEDVNVEIKEDFVIVSGKNSKYKT
jgi:HSP20 family molecular chaperone IbpA